MFISLINLLAAIVTVFALQATTTVYQDESPGACGCGPSINPYTFTAAGSPIIFGNGSWCGAGCGQCFQLTSTGASPPDQGDGGGVGTSIVVLITNLCPYEGNEIWCPEAGNTNVYGYSAHFDIDASSGGGAWSLLGWSTYPHNRAVDKFLTTSLTRQSYRRIFASSLFR